LENYISVNLEAWIESAVKAKYYLRQDDDYIVSLDRSNGGFSLNT